MVAASTVIRISRTVADAKARLPFPPNAERRAIVDAGTAATLDTVYCGIGRSDGTLEIGIADLIAATGTLVAPVGTPTPP